MRVYNLGCKIKIFDGGKMPTKGTERSACYDMYAREIEEIDEFTYKVRLGVALQPQSDYRVAIYPRSSISGTGFVLGNSVGVGDEDYTGEYMVVFKRVDFRHPFPYKVGDRVAQFELVPWYNIDFEIVDELGSTERGSGGFGSTGK